MIKAGIAGGAGYTGGELLRILANHPEVRISWCQSQSQTGKRWDEIHSGIFQNYDRFIAEIPEEPVDVLFLCMGHGKAREFLQQNSIDDRIKIIDLSHDYRIRGDHSFVYGLPELYREKILEANKIANPGCFATSIQLGLLPLFHEKKVYDDVHIHAITGSTGAGQALSESTHYSWRNNNISIYKAFSHQHLGEITQSFYDLDPDFGKRIHFVPVRGNFTRGILASIYLNTRLSQKEADQLYSNYYQNHPFVQISDRNPDIKMVVNTNFCILNIQIYQGIIHIISVIDNLTKGASGQAVQNMNLMFGLDEKAGLNLKASVF